MQGLDSLAIHGRYGDTMVGHLTPGEVVLPKPVATDPVLRRALFQAFERHELNPHQYTVGHFENSINPVTGAPEFGFFKKVGKFLKKAAPTIGKIVGFAVGGPAGAAIGGGLGSFASGGDLKDALKSAASGYVLGNVAGGFGVKGGQGLGSLNPFGKSSMFSNLGATATDAGGIGGFFQNVGARGASALGMGSVEGTAAANLLGKGGAFEGLSGLQKLGVGALGGAALGMFDEPEMSPASMPQPSGELGGYLQRPLTGATVSDVYGTEGMQPASASVNMGGIGSAGADPLYAQYLAQLAGDDRADYVDLAFPQFSQMRLADGGEVPQLDLRQSGGGISDPNGAGDEDTVDALLADGEFVMTKQAVAGIGGGNHDKGIKKMYAMMDDAEKAAKKMGIGRA